MRKTIRPRLGLAAARALLAEIAAGRLLPGAPLRELDACVRCGTSRTPVRQAFALLARAGVLEARGARGLSVRAGARAARRLLAQAPYAAAAAPEGPAFVDAARRFRALLSGPRLPRALRGRVIRDSAAARALGVSRTTANRALGLLARENLLASLPRRGWRRTLLEPRELLDMYDFRIAVEPAALEAAWAALVHASPALRGLYARTLQAARPGGIAHLPHTARVKLDLEFHRAVLAACPNPFLRRAMQEQEALRTIATGPSWRMPSRAEATFREHAAILRAILGRRKTVACAALRRHLRAARAATLALLQASDGNGAGGT